MSLVGLGHTRVFDRLCSQNLPGDYSVVISVAFFILKVGGGIIKLNLKKVKTFLMFFIEKHQRHQSVRYFMAKRCQKHSPLLGSIFRALLRPSIDPRARVDRPCCKIRLVQRHCRHSPLRAKGLGTTVEFECTNTIW